MNSVLLRAELLSSPPFEQYRAFMSAQLRAVLVSVAGESGSGGFGWGALPSGPSNLGEN